MQNTLGTDRICQLRVTNAFLQVGREVNILKSHSSEKIKVTALLSKLYGGWFTTRNISAMAKFARKHDNLPESFNNVAALSWQHNILLLKSKSQQALDFYVRMTVSQGLSVQQLRKELALNNWLEPTIIENFGKGKAKKAIVPIWVLAHSDSENKKKCFWIDSRKNTAITFLWPVYRHANLVKKRSNNCLPLCWL